MAAFYDVYNALGYGFLEKVYQNALCQELISRGFSCELQRHVEVYYKGCKVGDYYPDIVVDSCIILELKTVDVLAHEHEAQWVNYLRSTAIELGLLLNFGAHPQIVRRIYTNDRKNNLRLSV